MTELIHRLKIQVEQLTAEIERFGNQLIRHHQILDGVRDEVALIKRRMPTEWTNEYWRDYWEWYRATGGRIVLGKHKRIRRTKVIQPLPPGCKSVTRPTAWANPFVVGVNARDAVEAKELFREYLDQNPELVAKARKKLRDSDLACYCPLDHPCHADVWLELVND